jgi:hypothetical protein
MQARPTFPAETKNIRGIEVIRSKVEITGPVDRKMVIQHIIQTFMADLRQHVTYME